MAVTLEGARRHATFGVLTTATARTHLARAILQFPGNEPLETALENDALGEFANVIAGQIKAAMNAIDPQMRLGLPQMIRSDVLVTLGAPATLRVAFGTTPAALVAIVAG